MAESPIHGHRTDAVNRLKRYPYVMEMASRIVFIVIFLSLLLGAGSSAHDLSLSAGEPVQISPDGKNYYNISGASGIRSSAQHMVICGEVNVPLYNGLFSYVYTTADGGRTWHLGLMDRSSKWVSEESCAYGKRGVAYFTTGESNFYNGDTHHEEGTLHLYKSTDYGSTWKAESSQPFVDATIDAVDQTNGKYDGTLYVFANAATLKPGEWWGKTGIFEPGVFWLYHAVLLTSQDGGASLSGPVRAYPAGYEVGEAFAGGSLVLTDGTPIVAYETSHNRLVNARNYSSSSSVESRNAIDIMTSQDQGKSLNVRATVRDAGNLRVWPSAIVEDESNGPLRGRLYISWIETSSTHSAVMLGTSDDRGYHWTTHTVVQGAFTVANNACNPGSGPPRFSIPALAVNRDGMVGIAWAPNDGASVRFAVSGDGGRTFQPSIEIAGCSLASDTQYLENGMFAWPYDARLGEQRAAISSGSVPPTIDTSILAISINIQPERWASVRLLSESTNTFHVFWIRTGPGRGAIWTRSITVGSRPLISSTLVAHRGNPVEPQVQVHRTVEIINAAHDIKRKSESVAGLRDITTSVAFDFSNLSYDARAHIFTVGVSVINKGQVLVKRPLRIVALGFRSDFGVAHALNASAISSKGQPMWDVSDVVPVNGLVHEAATRFYTFRFRVSPFEAPAGGEGGTPVAMRVQVLGNVESRR